MRLLREARPDLLVLDVGLPGRDGFSLTREIRADASLHDLMVVAVTVHTFEHDRAAAADAGCDYFLPKPLQPSELVLLVNRILDGARGVR